MFLVLMRLELRTSWFAIATSATRDASKLVGEFLPQMGSPQPLSSLLLFRGEGPSRTHIGDSFIKGFIDQKV